MLHTHAARTDFGLKSDALVGRELGAISDCTVTGIDLRMIHCDSSFTHVCHVLYSNNTPNVFFSVAWNSWWTLSYCWTLSLSFTSDIIVLVLCQRCMLKELIPETCRRNIHEKFDTSSSQILAQQQLAGQSRCMACHVPDSFCPGILNCMQETCCRKNLYKIDCHTWMFVHVQDDLHKFLVQCSWACAAGIGLSLSI